MTRKYYTYDYQLKNEPPEKVLKWLRSQFPPRGQGWDFYLGQEDAQESTRGGIPHQRWHRVIKLEIWDEKCQVIYELWKA